MAKRFTDTEKWKKSWFMNLSMKHKLLWFYLLDNCDNAGIYDINLPLASFMIGEEITIEDIHMLNSNCVFIEDNKLFIQKFIDFQYGELRNEVKPHRSVIERLRKYSLFKEYPYSINTVKEKEKEKDKDKDKEKDKDKDKKTKKKLQFLENVFLTYPEVKRLLKKYGREQLEWMIVELDRFIPNSKYGRAYKDHNRVLQGWVAEKYINKFGKQENWGDDDD